MSQQPNSLVNGPYSDYNTPLKEEIVNKDVLTVQQNGSGPQSQQPPLQPPQPGLINAQRPLTRIDSRSSFQFRPPFPNQPGSPLRPGQVRQPIPPGSQQYIQRNPVPGPGQRPPVPQTPQNQAFPQAPQNRANYRPVTPYPRPPVQNQRPLFPQRSVPAFATQRPQIIEEGLIRSQTLDTTEIDHSKSPDEKITVNEHIKAPSIAAMNNRGYSLSSNPSEQPNESKDEARRRSISSVDSLGDVRPSSRQSSISDSVENLDKKSENEVPSRPESRAMSRMNKIVEDEDKSPGSLTNVSQKSPDLSNNFSDRSPTMSNSPESNASNYPKGNSKPQTPTRKSPSPNPQSPSPKLQSPSQSHQSPKPPASPGPQSRSPNEKKASPLPSKPRSPNQNANKDVDVEEKGPREVTRPEKLLNLEKPLKSKSPVKSEGDNDSGVDESTQGHDPSSNGDNSSPRKSNKSRTSCATPTARSSSRGSKSPSLKSPDSNATTPGSATDKKKVPMNRVQVGSAPSPNLKVIKSKIGSLDNASYRPGGGKVKIETKKLDFKAAAPRIEAKNDKYISKGGEKKIVQQKLHWNAKSKVGSLENATYKPKGGDKKIESLKLDFKEKAKSKVGSKGNIKHQPGGGDVKSEAVAEEKNTGDEKKSAKNTTIESKKIDLNVTSKIGSLDNMKHKPGGGDKKIFDDKEYLKQKSEVSSMDHSLSGSQEKRVEIRVEEEYVEIISSPKKVQRILTTVEEEETYLSGRFSRSGSVRKRNIDDSPRPRWRY